MLILCFIYGLCIGSFLNVCIYRIPANISLISPPSCCGSCGHRLSYIDMVPVVNYVVQKGRCRYCDSEYSIQYPIIELLNGLLYVLIVLKYGLTFYSAILCLFSSSLLVATAVDLKHMIIPDSTVLVAFFLGLLLLIYDNSSLKDKLIGFVIAFGLFFLIALTTKSMGGGDVKLMGAIGLLFGTRGAIFVSLFSFIIGALVVSLLLCFKIKGRKDKISFGVFIALASLTYIFFGSEIIDSYLNVFL